LLVQDAVNLGAANPPWQPLRALFAPLAGGLLGF